MRDIVSLACTECKRRNYSTTKNKKKTTERLEFSKYCRFCRKHIAHRETKQRATDSGLWATGASGFLPGARSPKPEA
jgi:large subunit ribosomal protein L33